MSLFAQLVEKANAIPVPVLVGGMAVIGTLGIGGMFLYAKRKQISNFFHPWEWNYLNFRTRTGDLVTLLEKAPGEPWVTWNGKTYFLVTQSEVEDVQDELADKATEETTKEELKKRKVLSVNPCFRMGRTAAFLWNEDSPWPVHLETGQETIDNTILEKFERSSVFKDWFSEGGFGEWAQTHKGTILLIVLALIAIGVIAYVALGGGGIPGLTATTPAVTGPGSQTTANVVVR